MQANRRLIRFALSGPGLAECVAGAAFVICSVLLSACAGEPEGRSAYPGAKPEDATDLILITVDTWRGDHFGTTVAGEELTPNLNRFAQSGVRFTAAHSAGNETSPGTAGILTGLTPRRSGVSINLHVLKAEVPSLAQMLSEAGFHSAGIVANPVLRPGTGFGLGFDSYKLVSGGQRPYAKASAEEVTRVALGELAELEQAKRFFLWVHYMDPHGPYLPPSGWRDRFPPERFGAQREIPLLPSGDNSGLGGVPAYQQLGLDPSPVDARDYLARYAAEVRSLDEGVGKLLDRLDDRGHLETAVVVLTSDHGEALVDDHGYYFSHGNGLTQDQIHVPLVLAGSGVPSGRRVEKPVSTLGVVPTVLGLVGIEAPGDHRFDGEHLLVDAPQIVLSASGRQTALRSGNWKAIWGPQDAVNLYELSGDPGETTNLAAEFPDRLESLTRLLREYRSRPAFTRPTGRQNLPEDEQEVLRALGYL